MTQSTQERTHKTTAVGVVGLGNIGSGVARSLIRSGHFDVHVWDVLPDAREPFQGQGGVCVSEPVEMGRVAEIVLFIVPTTSEIRSCLDGKGGLLKHARAGLTLCDLTTSDPQQTITVAASVARQGIDYLDAGTSGGPYKADVGKLLAMIGGSDAAFERARPVFETFCEHVFHVGPSGAGHTLKLLHNVVCHATTLVTAEAGHMAERAGIPLAKMIEVFNQSNARSYATEFRFPRHVLSESWDGRSRIFNLHKDLKMAVDLGRRLGADTTMSRATLDILDAAKQHGMQDDDYTLLYRDFDLFRKLINKPSTEKRVVEQHQES